jgi:hypothetical protein
MYTMHEFDPNWNKKISLIIRSIFKQTFTNNQSSMINEIGVDIKIYYHIKSLFSLVHIPVFYQFAILSIVKFYYT